REHRRAAVLEPPPLGADPDARGGPARARGDRRPRHRHARRAPGATSLGRQPAEGHHRALARVGLPDDALLRPHARDRRQHQAPDLRAPPRPRRRRRGDPLLLERAHRVPARLRPRAHALRRTDHRRASGCRGRRGCAAPRDARPRRGGGRRRMSDPAVSAIGESRRQLDLRRLARRHGWTVAVFVLLFLIVLYWRSSTAVPWGPFDVQSVAIDAMPLAFAACGQAIAIISGGIDLSIGSLMSLINVVAARWMVTMSLREAILFMLLVVLGGALAGVLTGTLIVVTRVADIIVTLSMLFVWAGAALAVMTIPGGGIPPRLGDLVPVDTVVTTWLPAALVILIVVAAVIWIPIRRSRLGLALYAIGSN